MELRPCLHKRGKCHLPPALNSSVFIRGINSSTREGLRWQIFRMPVKTYVYKHVADSQPLEVDVHFQADGSSTPKPIGESGLRGLVLESNRNCSCLLSWRQFRGWQQGHDAAPLRAKAPGTLVRSGSLPRLQALTCKYHFSPAAKPHLS